MQSLCERPAPTDAEVYAWASRIWPDVNSTWSWFSGYYKRQYQQHLNYVASHSQLPLAAYQSPLPVGDSG